MAENILSASCPSESPQEDSTRPLSSQETEMFVEPDHPEKVLEGLNRLRLNSTLCDVILCCEGQEFPCHRYVLASFSSYFEAMFTSGMRESTQERVSISGVEPQMIGLLVNYAYTSKVSISTANVQALLAASNLLDITAVQKACCDFMERHMDVNNLEDSTSVPLSAQETEMFVDPDHPSKVLEGLNRLRLNCTFCDVILCCEEQEFSCHRYVLASFCSYYEAMFTSGMRESTQERVSISGVEPQMIGLLVNYAYTSEVSISTENVQALLAASNLWDVTAVRNASCDFMKRHMDVNNCVGIYCFSEDHSCKILKKYSMDYILEYFSDIYQQQEFLALSVERLIEILASDHLNVPKEDMVFEAANMWLDKCPTRRQSFEKVLEQIRLPLISPTYLPTVILCLDVVKEYQGCQRFISDAKERPYCNTARPRRTSVIVTVGAQREIGGFAKVESFDPLNRQCKTLGYLPFKAQQYAVVASGSTLYLAGGREYLAGGRASMSASKEMWRYDVHHYSWLKMAPMNMARYNFSLVMLDGYVFAVGGDGSEKSKASMERYSPKTNTWQLLQSVVRVAYRDKSTVVLALERWLYFIGRASLAPTQAHVAKYHPVRSVWKKVAPMRIEREQSAACVLNGKIYVTGGYITGVSFIDDTMECYNPKTNQWTMCTSPKLHVGWAGRYGHSMAVGDGKMYILGGLEVRNVKDIACYCEETGTWCESVGWMPAGDYFKCVTLRLRNDYVPMVDEDDENYDDDSDSDDEAKYFSDTYEGYCNGDADYYSFLERY